MASNLKLDLKIWSEGQAGVSQVAKGKGRGNSKGESPENGLQVKVRGPLGESKNYSIAQGEGNSEGTLKDDSHQVARVR